MASEDGYVYYYDLNLEEGGDCAVIKQFNVTSSSSRASGSKRRNNAGNSEEEEDDFNEGEAASASGSPEGSINVFSDCSDSPSHPTWTGGVSDTSTTVSLFPSHSELCR